VPGFQLHLITDSSAAEDLPRAVSQALEGGVDWIQVREKRLPARSLFELARMVGERCRARGAGLLVNDRIDVALAAGAHGVHLGGKSLPVAVARQILPRPRLLGVSVHSLAEARAAERAGADYVTMGSVFPTRSHPGLSGVGLEELRRVVEGVEIPVLAIGGITAANIGEVLATGVAGVAVISAILMAPSPRLAAAELRRAMDEAPGRPRRPFPRP